MNRTDRVTVMLEPDEEYAIRMAAAQLRKSMSTLVYLIVKTATAGFTRFDLPPSPNGKTKRTEA